MTGRHELDGFRPYLRHAHAAAGTSYTPRQVAQAYGCPVDRWDGTGVTIGVIELGGGYNPDDMAALKLPTGNVTVVSVDGATSRSDGPQGADGEVMLDVEVIASVAPGAHQRVYFAPNTDTGFLRAIQQATTECDLISISWGSAESSWSERAVSRFANAFAAARARGVTVFVASGDAGSRDGTARDTVDYPASDPSVIGCGGTKLLLDSSGARASEVVWDENDTTSATGGGISRLFPGRTVPDVAGNADPVTGYQCVVDGQHAVIGGTSAVAPLYAAMTAVLRQAHPQPFDLLNLIATNPGTAWDVTSGGNGGFRAGPGRDSVSGYGVVDYGRLLAILQSGTQVPTPGGTVPPAPTPTPPPAPQPADADKVIAAAMRSWLAAKHL